MGRSRTEPIITKICMVGSLTCAKLKFLTVTILQGGGRISHFPIDFCMFITVQRSDELSLLSHHLNFNNVTGIGLLHASVLIVLKC